MYDSLGGDWIYRFFYATIRCICKSFTGIFGEEDKEVEGDIQTGQEKDSGAAAQKQGYNSRFWHVRMIDIVAQTYRCNWDEACHLNVYEFLNVYSYFIATQRMEKKMMEQEYAKIKSKYRH